MKFLLLLLSLIPALCTFASSINCNAPHTPTDRIICKNSALMEADAKLAKVYHDVIIHMQSPSFYQSNFYRYQKEWIAKRNACKDAACILQAYNQRQQYLQNYLNEPEPIDGPEYQTEMDQDTYFMGLNSLKAIPLGAEAILPCDKAEIKKVVQLLMQNADIKILVGTYEKIQEDFNKIDYHKFPVVYFYTEDDNLYEQYGLHSSPITIYKGNFSNEGIVQYALISGSRTSDVLAIYDRVGNRLEKNTSYGKTLTKNIHWPDADGYGMHQAWYPFAFVKNQKTYLRYGEYPGEGRNYDKSKLITCTYMWNGKDKDFKLVGPNLKVAENGTLVDATRDCYS